MSVGRDGGLDDPPTSTRTRHAARITSGRPGPPVAPRPAGCPILTRGARDRRSRNRAGTRPGAAGNYRGCDALPRGPPARPRRGPARTPRRRPLPLARGRRRPAHRRRGREAQDALTAELLGGLPMRAEFAARLEKLVHAGAVGVPVWRGDRAFSTRRDPGQEHAVLRVREADGTVRVLVDPMALDPAGTTTLDAWSPSWEGDRLAYQLSTGGDEESRLYVLDVATGEVDRRPGRPLPLLPRRLAARRRGAVLRAPPRPGRWCPPARSSSTAACGATGSAPRPTPTCSCTARAATRPPTSACTPAATAAGWSSPARPAPRRATTSGSPTSPADGALRDFQVGVDAQTAAWVARDGRLWLMSDRDTPRWRLAVADPADPATWAPEAWQDVVPQQPDAVLSDVALVDGPDGDLQVLAVHAVDATDRLSVWAADGSGRLRRRRRGLGVGSISGVSSAAGGRRRRPGSATPTTRPRRRCCAGTPASPTALHELGAGGRRRRRPGADRRRDARDVAGRDAGAPVRAVRLGHARTPRARPCSTATAASTSRSPRPTPRRRWPGWPPAACGRSPTCAAAPSTARSGTGRACASASRTCSTTSPPPGSTWWPRAGRRTSSWP